MASCNNNNNNNNNISPPLCAKGCGFFGNPATHNMCSKCYSDFLNLTEERLKLLAIVGKPLNTKRTTNNSVVDINSTSSTTCNSTTESSSSINKKINRCQCCNKRVGLTGFECRCGGLFCGIHRYPEEHACDFDFKTLGRLQLAKQNPLWDGDKLRERA